MVQEANTKKTSLEKVSLGYEYDMSWAEAKKAVRARTDKFTLQ